MNNEPMNNENLSATPLDAILADAERVSKSGTAPRFTRDQAETAMIELAKREARDGEGTAASFARLCETDARMDALYALGQAADVAEVEAATKAAPSGDPRFDRLLIDMAQMRKRDGETIEACASRLLQTDDVVKAAYEAVYGG